MREKKLDSKAKRSVFVGYGNDRVKGYRVFDELQGKIVISRHVQFKDNISRAQQQVFQDDTTDEDDDGSIISKSAENAEGVDSASHTEDGVPVSTRKSVRQKKARDRYGEWVTTVLKESDNPRSYAEAMQH